MTRQTKQTSAPTPVSTGSLPAEISVELEARQISIEVWSALKNSLFPGAADRSVLMAWDYCAARGLDIMLKPVHLVPMWIKDKNNGDKGEMRDVVMPGIGLYRVQADRSKNYAGMSAPTFGPETEYELGAVNITVPEWCEITVSKLIEDRIVTYTAREYWIENYATAGRDKLEPNAMWNKRPRGQLVKCAEAQALRKGWPEIGAQPTAEEMEGKQEIDITDRGETLKADRAALPDYSDDAFNTNFPKWQGLVESGKKTAEQIITMVGSKAVLSETQQQRIKDLEVPENENA